jgi:hypothetical protein
MEWLHAVHVTLHPDEEGVHPTWGEDDAYALQSTGKAKTLWEGSPILEISHSRNKLVWQIEEDAFARYVVHCCCRFHSVVSYSKSHFTTIFQLGRNLNY